MNAFHEHAARRRGAVSMLGEGSGRQIERPIVEAPKGPARIMTAIDDNKLNRWHLQIADRWIVQYNLYVNDQRWGRIFLR
jgi:hypothetical protein